MPAQDRQQTLRLPNIEEDKPFSALFGTAFDMATVESAAQLADSSIFVTSSGSRFRIERIADRAPIPPPEKRQPQLSSLKSFTGPRIQPQSLHLHSGVRITTAATTLPSQPFPPSHARALQTSPTRHDYHPGLAAATQPTDILPSKSSPRSSVASATSRSLNEPRPRSGAGSSTDPAAHHAVSDDSEQATAMMEMLSLGEHGFGASALYTHSDGGVLAAETLTDSLMAERLDLRSNPTTDYAYSRPPEPEDTDFPRQQQSPYRYGCPDFQDPYYTSESFSNPSSYPRHADLPYRTEGSSHSPSRTSADELVDKASTAPDTSPPAYAYSPPATSSAAQQPQRRPQHHSGSFSFGSLRLSGPGKQTGPMATPGRQSLPSLMEYSVVQASPPPLPGSPSRHSSRTESSFLGSSASTLPLPDASDEADGAVNYSYDTQTPVFVRVHTPPPPSQPSSSAPVDRAPPPSTRAGAATDNSSSAGSRDRDNVLPGEELLYDGAVSSGHVLEGPFEQGHLKVFRNSLSGDLRFHCRVGNNTEIHWLKGIKAQLVPMYAYDQRSLTVVIRDRDDGLSDGDRRPQQQQQQQQRQLQDIPPNGPLAMYQFAALKDLFTFQSRLTGEHVVLDISSVKWIRLGKANSRSREMYSSVRLQIWHEPRSRRTSQSDVASFVTAGTTLSGPLRERTVPNSSRLMVFLGRSDQYITSFITDDIEMEPKGNTSASLRPRKYGGLLDRRNSRPGIKARLEKKTGAYPAGFDIHGEPYNPDMEQSFDLYKTFEIEFESSPSQINFVQAWNEVIEERRKQRARLARIQESMRRETFSSKEALTIRT